MGSIIPVHEDSMNTLVDTYLDMTPNGIEKTLVARMSLINTQNLLKNNLTI